MAEIVPAEIEPMPDRGRAAARALQQLGFRVLHVGPTISVEGPTTLWNEIFQVAFEPGQTASVPGPDTGSSTPFEHEGALIIPPRLEGLIRDVAFVRPPEFF